MVVDGAYLFMAAKDISNRTNRKLIMTKEKFEILDNYIQSRINRKMNEKHFITAEDSLKTAESRTYLYSAMVEQGYQLNLKTFKQKKAYCPDKKCHFNKGFDTKV